MREKRNFPRYECLVEIAYSSAMQNQEGYCFSKNISKIGLCLSLDKYIFPNQSLNIGINLPDEKICIRASVVWCRRNKNHWEALYSAGVKFEQMPPESAAELMAFAAEHQWQKNDFEKALETRSIPMIK